MLYGTYTFSSPDATKPNINKISSAMFEICLILTKRRFAFFFLSLSNIFINLTVQPVLEVFIETGVDAKTLFFPFFFPFHLIFNYGSLYLFMRRYEC